MPLLSSSSSHRFFFLPVAPAIMGLAGGGGAGRGARSRHVPTAGVPAVHLSAPCGSP
jgi:hypothetical protein